MQSERATISSCAPRGNQDPDGRLFQEVPLPICVGAKTHEWLQSPRKRVDVALFIGI